MRLLSMLVKYHLHLMYCTVLIALIPLVTDSTNLKPFTVHETSYFGDDNNHIWKVTQKLPPKIWAVAVAGNL